MSDGEGKQVSLPPQAFVTVMALDFDGRKLHQESSEFGSLKVCDKPSTKSVCVEVRGMWHQTTLEIERKDAVRLMGHLAEILGNREEVKAEQTQVGSLSQ